MSSKEYEDICSSYLIDKAKESSQNLTIGNSLSTLDDVDKGSNESEDSFNVLTIEPSKSTFNNETDSEVQLSKGNTRSAAKEKDKETSYINQDDVNHAKAAGFGIRLETTKYGDQSLRKKQERKSYSKVTGCMAMIGFDRNAATNKITVYAFEDAHNHPLTEFNEENICSPNHRLSIFYQELIVKASTINIGATKAHKLRASLKGGYDNLPATKNDFKNFWRDYTNIVGPNDAQCVVDQLIIRRDNYQNFNFQYKLDDDVLNAMFWVDETGRENYSKFSDVISMDATYRTNRYNMIFVPFTAINNHDKTINVGAGLISDETIESYSWLLEAFLSSHKKKPTMILSDMDAALSCSISKVFQGCTHRLCMWHIMSKMPSKIEADLVSNSDFKKRINQLVWNMNIKPSEFENKWDLMLNEFHLKENKWLADMFNKRDKWIPSYFRDIPMCGLMKTTSRSKRYEQKRLDIASRDTSPQLLFTNENLKIEKHASLCFQKNSVLIDGRQQCTIIYKELKSGKRPEFKVSFDAKDETIECECLHFTFFGILCSHAFRILIDYDIPMIPEKYILDRWRKNIVDIGFQKINQKWRVCSTEISNLLQDATSFFEKCVESVIHDKEKLQELVNSLQQLSETCGKDVSTRSTSIPIKDVIANIIGVPISSDVKIKVPSEIKTKSLKPKRKCKGCNQLVNHDVRNCPLNPSNVLRPFKKHQ
ncbi:protein FAR1-RELATED SEQUENCE 5-like [Lactuca sativa]|uniref:protein FAR1-RELATED SEQUENCE 5-like n=1 Tax=Lactuca sativa TaxID=4236 RepID=UPI0022AFAD11|nr:protein FAR1-RELATED SEQUENCE 5-like [Lactuca sativa]